jgi:hypothetical protein
LLPSRAATTLPFVSPTEGVFTVRRAAICLYAFALTLALPVAAYAATSSTSSTSDVPAGHDGTLTSIFIVAVSIPAFLTVMTLIDVARGKHTGRRDH